MDNNSHEDRRRNGSALVMWILVLLIYVMDIFLWVVDVRNVVAELNTTLIDTHPGTLDERYRKSTNSILKLSLVDDAVYSFMTILGDTIVLRRVYAFWSHGRRERIFMLIPCATWIGSVNLTVLLGYCAARSDGEVSFGQFEHPAFCRNIQAAAYWTQLATSAVSTLMIGIKTWMYRRTVKSYMTDLRGCSPANKAMLILVDTGILYTLFFLSEVLLNIGVLDGAINKDARLDFALAVYDFQTSTMVGIYPTIIVILVHTQCFMLDKEGNTAALTTINFDDNRVPGRPVDTTTADDTMTIPSIGWRDMEGLGSGVLDSTTKRSDNDSEERSDTEIYLRSFQPRMGIEPNGILEARKDD
ncbi:hypothetical protein BC629DRAFT_1556613 [Irpex lacteus]|nr:hypothetical protein BC629DRAFT_1556613 [Irpex lacteus]